MEVEALTSVAARHTVRTNLEDVSDQASFPSIMHPLLAQPDTSGAGVRRRALNGQAAITV